MSRLFIVCGLPGVGKTSFAAALSKKIKVAVIHKDSIKECLFDEMKMATEAESKLCGMYSIKVLYRLAEIQLENDVDIIIESPFRFAEDFKMFERWKKRYTPEIFSIVCFAKEEERKRRFSSRERHFAHTLRDANMVPYDQRVHDKFPGKIVRIETNKPVDELVDGFVETHLK